MRTLLSTILIFIPILVFSQDSLFRVESPVAAKIGFQGVGLDLALGDRIGIDATTWVLSTSINARYFILTKNASPFIGVGIGKFGGGFGGGSENQYSIGFIGWEHSYEVFVIQIIVQQTFYEKYSYGYSPFIVNLNIGARIY